MKLGILIVTLRELNNSFPQCRVSHLGNRMIVLIDNDFNEYTVYLDEEGRILNRAELVKERQACMTSS